MAERPQVLIIDDEAPMRQLWCDFLGVVGCDAEAVPDGEEGLARFERGRYDLVVTDQRMPGCDGRTVARIVRERDPSVGVLLITGMVDDLETESTDVPGVMILKKPVTMAAFREAVAACLPSARRPLPPRSEVVASPA